MLCAPQAEADPSEFKKRAEEASRSVTRELSAASARRKAEEDVQVVAVDSPITLLTKRYVFSSRQPRRRLSTKRRPRQGPKRMRPRSAL